MSSIFSIFVSLVTVFILFSNVLPTHAADDDILICGDYQYTPLAGYLTKNDTIRPGKNWIYLNTSDRKTQKDLDTPTIYCLTEENMENFEYRFPKKDEIFAQTLKKEESIYKIANEKCDFDNKNVYLLLKKRYDGWRSTYDFIVIEFNEYGNKYDSIFVISSGILDRDVEILKPDSADEEKRRRMCGRANELIGTIKKR